MLQISLSYISVNLLQALTQLVTGKLLTDRQIQKISSHLVGQIVGDWLPEPKAQREAKQRVEKATSHLAEATRIVSELKEEIDGQVKGLESLAKEVEEKRKKAEEYTALIRVGEPAIQAIRTQLEASIRKQLEEQAKKGRRFRLAANLLVWLITLVAGAALGAHWNGIEGWVKQRVKSAEIQQQSESQTTERGGNGGKAPNPAAPADRKAPLSGR